MRLFHRTWRRVLGLAWPIVATGAIRVTMRTVDVLVVGIFVGPAAVAAVGIADVIGRVVLQTALGLGAGTIALVSQHYGAGRHRDANIVATQTAVVAGMLGVPITVLGWWLSDDFFRLLGASDELIDYGVLYLRVVLISATFRIIAMMLVRALQGTGDTRTPMAVRTGATLVNITLTVVLVIGVGPFPAYGVLGAAIGTAVGNTLAGMSMLAVMASRCCRITFVREGLWAPEEAWRILRIGAPQVLDRNLYALGEIPLNAIILVFGTEANAAYQIGRRVQQYARMPSRGGSTASSTLVGNHLGRREPEQSDRHGRGSLALTVVITSALAVALFLFAPLIAAAFGDEPSTLTYATQWIRVLAIGAVFRSTFTVLRGALQGAGDTRSPLYASIIGISGFALLFSYIVGVRLGMGIIGVYAGVTLDYAVRSVILYRRFNVGRWKHAAMVED